MDLIFSRNIYRVITTQIILLCDNAKTKNGMRLNTKLINRASLEISAQLWSYDRKLGEGNRYY